MSKHRNNVIPTLEQVLQAIRDSWSAETCDTPAEWTPDNPSWQQCDVSAFVAWEHLGGELVLGKVTVNGADAGFHYWNRIDGNDVDLTRSQFIDGEQVTEIEVLTDDFIQTNLADLKPVVSARIDLLRDRVNETLSA